MNTNPGPPESADLTRDGHPIPTREPVHEVDRQYARLQRRLAVGGFAILIGLAVLFATVQYGGIAAAIGATIIVGGGLIRDEVLGQLRWYRDRGTVRSYREDSPNRGAIVVTLRD